MSTLTQFHHFWLFFVLVLGVVIMPGMDMAFVLASSLAGGRKQGFAAVLGTVVGGMLHVALAVAGVAILLKTLPSVFNAMLLLGSAYIAWVGLSLVRGASALGEVRAGAKATLTEAFVRALVTCMLNPKAYVFMLAIFPPFLRPEYGPVTLQAIILSAIIAGTQIAIYGALALGASRFRVWLVNNPASQILLGQAIGVMLITAALWTAFSGLMPA
jgi:threonine/homoserine/homoserine lactone efflux protein